MSGATPDVATPVPVLRRPSVKRIMARDRNRSAIHEASHAVVAMLLGYDANAWIFPIDGVEDIWSDKTWRGRCTVFFVSDLKAATGDQRSVADEDGTT
jgi:hypothetical protein